MLKPAVFTSVSLACLMLGTTVLADEVTVQDARTAVLEYAVQNCGGELGAVNEIMGETDRVSALDSGVAMAKDLGSWTNEWPMNDATLKASGFIEVIKNQDLEATMLVSFAEYYANSEDEADVAATRYQGGVVAAKTSLAECLMPTDAEVSEVSDRLADSLKEAMTQVSCPQKLAAAAALSSATVNEPSTVWGAAAADAAPQLTASCGGGE